jgi:hypothetical protein
MNDDVGSLLDEKVLIIRQHTSVYVSIRQHTSAYVSIRQHTSLLDEKAFFCFVLLLLRYRSLIEPS